MQGVEQAERHRVVAREDGGDVGVVGDELPRAVAALRRPVARDLRSRQPAPDLVGAAPPGATLLGLHPVSGTADVRDVAVAEVEQVPDGQLRAALLVDAGRQRGAGHDSLHGDDRDGEPQGAGHLGRVAVGDGDHDRLDGLVEQAVDGVVEELRGEVGQPDQRHVVPLGVTGLLHAERDHARAVQREVGGDHADAARAVGREQPRGEVAPVAELLDGGEHPQARLLLDQRGVVEHPRHRLVRHTRPLGDLRHARRALASASPGSGLPHARILGVGTPRPRPTG